MYGTIRYLGSITNTFLMCASLLFIWYALFYLKLETKPHFVGGLYSNFYDSFIPFHNNHYVILTGFSIALLTISIFGYMTVDDKNAVLVLTEIILLLISIALEFLSLYLFHNDKREQQQRLADYMYNGVVLYHEATRNESNGTLRWIYDEINDSKLRCCGVYSWKDAESFRPIACCPRGYQGKPGTGTCHPRYGAYPTSCIEARGLVLDRHVNKCTLYLIALILFQFLGILLCGMHLFMVIHEQPMGFFIGEKTIKKWI